MGKIAKTLRAIKAIKNPKIKSLLLTHFNHKATEYLECYGDTERRQGFAFDHATASGIPFAFANAPRHVCTALTDIILEGSVEEQAEIFSEKDFFTTILTSAPEIDRNRITHGLQFLPEVSLIAILGGASVDFNYFLTLLSYAKETNGINLITALGSLNTSHLSGFLRTSRFPMDVFGHAQNLFEAKELSSAVALAFLDILAKFDDATLFNIFMGKSRSLTGNFEKNLLHSTLTIHDRKVISKAFTLIRRFDEESQLKLFEHRAEFMRTKLLKSTVLSEPHKQSDYRTVFDLIFKDKQTKNKHLPLTLWVLEELEEARHLLNLLFKVSFSHPESPLHGAAQLNNLPALTYILKDAGVPFFHPTWSNETIKDIAKKNNRTGLQELCDAAELLEVMASQPEGGLKKTQEKEVFTKIFNKNPAVFERPLYNGKTLLHEAVMRQRPDLLEHMLQLGVPASLTDDKNKSPLDYAMTSIYDWAYELLIQKPEKNQIMRFDILLSNNANDYLLLKKMMVSLNAGSEKEKAQSLTFGLSNMVISKIHTAPLKELLTNRTGSASFTDLLPKYCENQNDAPSWYLYETAKFLTGLPVDEWAASAETFLKCRLIHFNGDSLTQEAAHLQIVVFLLNLSANVAQALLEKCALTERERKQLDLVLCQALLQPRVYSFLSLSDHENLVGCIHASEAIKSLAHLHFAQSELSKLPAPLLMEFAHLSDIDFMYTCCQQQLFNGVLHLLTWQKMLEAPLINPGKIKELSSRLKATLSRLNENTPLNQHKIAMLFNLATHKKTKAVLRDYFKELNCDAPMVQMVDTLFKQTDRKDALIKEGFLWPCFMDIACNAEKTTLKAFEEGFVALIKQASFKDIVRILKTHTHPPIQQKQIKNIEANLLKGIKGHADEAKLLHIITKWHLNNIHSGQKTFLSMMPHWVATQTQDSWNETEEYLQDIVKHLQDMESALNTLYTLFSQSPDNEAIISALRTLEKKSLKALIWFSTKIQDSKMNALANAALHNLPNPSLEYSLKQDETPWLSDVLKNLTRYGTHALSIYALKTGLANPAEKPLEQLGDLSTLLQSCPVSISPAAFSHLLISWEPLLLQDLLSDESLELIDILADILNKAPLSHQVKMVNAIPESTLTRLMQHCLSGMTSDHPKRVKTCKELLLCLSLLCGDETEGIFRKVIKHHLGAQDMGLLESESLTLLATDILQKQADTLEENTFNGLWIQRLLLSPRFVASCPAKTLHHLSERYRLISLTLKQDEFASLSRLLGVAVEEQAKIPEPKTKSTRFANLTDKRRRLLTFRVDDSLRTLFNQLENACASDKEYGNQALDILYQHYHQQLSSLRSDFLFNLSDFLYAFATCKAGDLEIAQSSLLRWLALYLPYQNFEQRELSRTQEIYLYNDASQKIGFISEQHEALSLDPTPKPLLHCGATIGANLYDSLGNITGTLTKSGHVRYQNLFQRHTCALLLAQVSKEELAQSEPAIELLILNIIREESLSILFDSATMQEPSKRNFIEQQIIRVTAKSNRPLTATFLTSIIAELCAESVFELLTTMKEPENTRTLFNLILNDDEKRAALFEEQNALTTLLNKGDAELFLAEFITEHHDKPWFAEGLSCFVPYADACLNPNLLLKALVLIGENTNLQESLCRKIMSTLITNPCARIILKLFREDGLSPVQSLKNSALSIFTGLLTKSDILKAMDALNHVPIWDNSAPYYLLLSALSAHHETFFPAEELRLSDTVWDPSELQALTTFTKRHLALKTTPDKDKATGAAILSELALRTANAGLADLFFTHGRLDTGMLRTNLTRTTLDALLAGFSMPKEAQVLKNTYTKFRASMDSTFEHQQSELQKLKDNGVVANWAEICDRTWKLTQDKELPLLSAWLVNFSGSKEDLEALLTPLFAQPHIPQNQKTWYTVCELMVRFPWRDFSAVVFHALEKAVVARPGMVDSALLLSMAHFYCNKSINEPLTAHNMVSLLQHFGQQKHFVLVHECCHLLKNNPVPELEQIKTEALIEMRLEAHKDRWYFWLVKSALRLWYGCDNTQSIVKNCDDLTAYPPLSPPDMVTTTLPPVREMMRLKKAGQKMGQARDLKAQCEEIGKPVRVQRLPMPLPSMAKNQVFFAEQHRLERIPGLESRTAHLVK